MSKPRQPILGIVAPRPSTMSASQKEMYRRAGTLLSPGQRAAATRRAKREEEAEEMGEGGWARLAESDARAGKPRCAHEGCRWGTAKGWLHCGLHQAMHGEFAPSALSSGLRRMDQGLLDAPKPHSRNMAPEMPGIPDGSAVRPNCCAMGRAGIPHAGHIDRPKGEPRSIPWPL